MFHGIAKTQSEKPIPKTTHSTKGVQKCWGVLSFNVLPPILIRYSISENSRS